MGMLSEIASNRCADEAIRLIKEQFHREASYKTRLMLLQLAIKMNERLNAWAATDYQRTAITSMTKDLQQDAQ